MHVVHRFDFGGLENGLVNLINYLSEDAYQHTIVALTEIGEISKRLKTNNVSLIALDKPSGLGLATYYRLLGLIRKLQPDVLHTRNLGTLDVQPLGWLCRIPLRIHSEHGRDVDDPDGLRTKPKVLRRLFAPFVHRWICVSMDLLDWCRSEVGIASNKLAQICNGVDNQRFVPVERVLDEAHVVFATVSRLSPIKDPLNLIHAFSRLSGSPRLVVAGDGPLLADCKAQVDELEIAERVTFLGAVADAAPVYAAADVFVLSSKREGISNTVLEAMSCGKPVVACRAGGNVELVTDETGMLVEPENAEALSKAMQKFIDNPGLIQSQGLAGRARVDAQFALTEMRNKYDKLYRGQRHSAAQAEVTGI